MSTVFGPEMDAALVRLTARIIAEFPEAGAILERVKAEGGNEADAMGPLMLMATKNPEMAKRIEAMAEEAFANVRQPIPQVPATIVDPGSGIPLVIPDPAGSGLDRLNPLYEAAVQERIQFDGDIPELRSGPMPKGAKPAVPVDTVARNPVAVGRMLEEATEQVQSEMGLLEAKHTERAQNTAELIVAGDPQSALRALDRNLIPDPKGYEKNQLPAHRTVEPPSGTVLAHMTPEEEHMAAWKFLSTTQGRRTAIQAIRALVANKLREDGLGEFVVWEAEPHSVKNPLDVLAYAEWSVDISGKNAMQPGFAFVDVAALSLARNLATKVGHLPNGVVLEVIPINTVDVRKVGWAARLVQT